MTRAREFIESYGVEINESPMRIKLDSKYVEKHKKDILDNLDKANLVSIEREQVGFYHLVTNLSEYYFLYKDGIIYYLVSFKLLYGFDNVFPAPFRQCLVWRNKVNRSPATVGFADRVFWDILFKEYECVVSDSQQSKDGEGFWDKVIDTAFKKGYIIKIHNTNDKTYTEYKSMKEFDSDKSKAYGNSNFYQRFIISVEKK